MILRGKVLVKGKLVDAVWVKCSASIYCKNSGPKRGSRREAILFAKGVGFKQVKIKAPDKQFGVVTRMRWICPECYVLYLSYRKARGHEGTRPQDV